jgi:hypothetical protein
MKGAGGAGHAAGDRRPIGLGGAIIDDSKRGGDDAGPAAEEVAGAWPCGPSRSRPSTGPRRPPLGEWSLSPSIARLGSVQCCD